MEIWKEVPGFEGLYQASNLGRIKGHKGNVLKAQKINCGYLVFHTCIKQQRKTQLVHRMVAFAFLPKTDICVNHKNGDKTDNRIENLEWVSYAENMKHARDNGLAAEGPPRKFAVIGTPVGGGADIVFISQIAAEVALTGRASSAIHHCLIGKKKSAYGHTWRRV